MANTLFSQPKNTLLTKVKIRYMIKNHRFWITIDVFVIKIYHKYKLCCRAIIVLKPCIFIYAKEVKKIRAIVFRTIPLIFITQFLVPKIKNNIFLHILIFY